MIANIFFKYGLRSAKLLIKATRTGSKYGGRTGPLKQAHDMFKNNLMKTTGLSKSTLKSMADHRIKYDTLLQKAAKAGKHPRDFKITKGLGKGKTVHSQLKRMEKQQWPRPTYKDWINKFRKNPDAPGLGKKSLRRRQIAYGLDGRPKGGLALRYRKRKAELQKELKRMNTKLGLSAKQQRDLARELERLEPKTGF